VVTWTRPNCYPSEPVFVPNPTGSGAEDDGVLLSQVRACVCVWFCGARLWVDHTEPLLTT